MKIGILIPSIYMRDSLASLRVSSTVKLSLAVALSNQLTDLGHEVYVFGPKDIRTKATVVSSDEALLFENFTIDEQQDISPEAFEKVSLYERKKLYEIGLTSFAYDFAEKNNIDIMHHFHSLGYLSHYFTRAYSIPTVFTIHNPPPSAKTLTHYEYEKFCDHRFITISQSHKSEYLSKYPQMNIADVIYHGVDLSNIPFSESSDNYLAFIGRATEDKGLDIAIELSIYMKKELQVASWMSDIVLHSDYYVSKIKPHLHSKYITLKGLIPPDEKDNFYKNAKGFIFPLRWSEPFGMVLLESMSTGTPVIAYANGSIPEIVKDGETGFLVNMDETHTTGDWIVKKKGHEGLMEAISLLYSLSPEKYAQMRQNSRKHVENNFTEEIMVQNHLKLYQRIIKKS